jgi:hypothetical protein
LGKTVDFRSINAAAMLQQRRLLVALPELSAIWVAPIEISLPFQGLEHK